jgi:hypothetical protein
MHSFSATLCYSSPTPLRGFVIREAPMAKGQQRQPKEKKKAKADNKTKQVSSYKAQFGGGSQTVQPMHNMSSAPKKN